MYLVTMTLKLLYLSLIGRSLTAVCNSIYFQINELGIKNPNDWKLDLAISETSSQRVEDLTNKFTSYKNEFETSKDFPMPQVEGFTISEFNVIDIINTIESHLKKYEKENVNTIIFDITAGRKIMSVAITLSAIKFWRNNKNRDVRIAYFLLKNLKKNSDKLAPELFPDEYEIRTWSVEEITKLMDMV
ncbi:hypothetical protein ES708_17671 [subsurface metagenome]